MMIDAKEVVKDEKYYAQALAIVAQERTTTTSSISRRLRIGFVRAVSIIERLEHDRIISKPNKKGLREVVLLDRRRALKD